MPVSFPCDNCQKSLRVNDDLGGKKVRCPHCQGVTNVPAPPPPPVEELPELTELVTDEPADAFGDLSPEPGRRAARPEPRPAGRPVLWALLGLAGVGAAVAAVTLAFLWPSSDMPGKSRPQANRTSAPKEAVKPVEPVKTPVEPVKPATPPADPVKPVKTPVEPVKTSPQGEVEAEIAKAAEGVKLVTLDLTPMGLDATIRVPEGSAIAKIAPQIDKDEHFALFITHGRGWLDGAKAQGWRPAVVSTADMLISSDRDGKEVRFVRETVLGHQDVAVFAAERFGSDGKPTAFTRADALLMAYCARTLALKSPPPADPAAALEPFLDRGDGKHPEGTFKLNSKATDATMALLAKVGGVRHLNTGSAHITDAGLIHLRGLPDLRALELGSNLALGLSKNGLVNVAGLKKLMKLDLERGGDVDDDALKHLSGLTDLEELSVRGFFGSIKGPGLAHLSGLKRLRTLSLVRHPIDDAGLEHLAGLKALESVNVSGTKVTKTGVEKARKASPKLKIEFKEG